MEVKIRLATKADAAAFNEVVALCSQQLDEQGFDHWRYYYSEQKVDERLNTTQTFVATVNGKVVGCVCYDSNVGKDDFTKKYGVELESEMYAILTTLAVLPKFQNQGIGDKLMTFVEDIATKEGRIPIITMRYELKNLVDFYARRNYVEIGRMIVEEDEQYSLLIQKK